MHEVDQDACAALARTYSVLPAVRAQLALAAWHGVHALATQCHDDTHLLFIFVSRHRCLQVRNEAVGPVSTCDVEVHDLIAKTGLPTCDVVIAELGD